MSVVSFLGERVSIYVGDCFDVLPGMDPDSVDCVVTSPPYWGLRDYGVDGQIGLEKTLGEHLAIMVRLFEAVRRVLKPTGTLWLNYGDCYATSPNGRSAADTKAAGNDDRTFRDKPFSTIGGVLKAKDLAMVPNRLAIALQEAGWWVRSEIVWAKPNPMPESVKDRPATSHEKIFMLTKSARYWYDAHAVRQPAADSSLNRWAQDVESQEGSYRANGGAKTNGTMKAVGGPRKKQDATADSAAAVGGSSGRRMAGFNERWDAKERRNENANGFRGGSYVGGKPGKRQATGNVPGTNDRNLRNYEPAPVNVWNIATQPFSDAHFATFPPELAERCILAGCPKGGLVLDPFGGAGTTALVALRHQRRAALIELNPVYAEMARRRIETEWRVPQRLAAVDYGPLFGPEAAA
jgi:DNA modification methylase